MSANNLIATVLAALVVVALMVRVIAGPLPGFDGGGSRYAAAKFGPMAEPMSDEVQMAVGEAPARP